MTFDLSSLPRLRPGVARRRASTWDRTGGNDDSLFVPAGHTVTIAEDTGPGRVTHLWTTLLTPDLYWGRRLVLRAYWDGEQSPSVEVPFGDFFGAGNCIAAPFSSAVLEAAPRDARSLHCWFPMPFADGFRITVTNESDLPVFALYTYVDYERWPEADPDAGRFHAWWNRTPRAPITGPPGTYEPALHASADGNYEFVSVRGRGHYVGAMLSIASADGGWYGEGDDMIFVDSEEWPPALHGTGTEDYFGTAWGPAEPFSSPSFGQPVSQREDWAGFSTVYRFHLHDPITFERSLRATIERGHANDRSDDYSSVAYWYQVGRTEPLPPLAPVADRLPPWPARWAGSAERVHTLFKDALARAEVFADPVRRARFLLAASFISGLAARADWDRIDAACAWLSGEEPPLPSAPVPPQRAASLESVRDLGDEQARATLESAETDAVLEEIFRTWAGAVRPDDAGDSELVYGFRIRASGVEHAWQLALGGGRCVARRARASHERITLSMDLLTLARVTLDQLDPWEAALRGRLEVAGDSSLAFRLPIFGRRSLW